jgi:predicted transcriptional regulator
MPEKTTLSKRQGELAALLHRTGMGEKPAILLAALANGEELTSRALEQMASLRQPEVSIAMKEMRVKGWAKKREIKRPGKGRPHHAYRLTVPIRDIAKDIETNERRKLRESEEALTRLRRLMRKF